MPQNSFFILLVLGAAGALYWWYQNRGGEGEKGAKNSSILLTYTTDLTKEAEAKKLDPVIGRAEEIERVIHILSRRSKNNPLLLGEPGVGKTAIVEGIARRIVAGDVPKNLKNKRVLALDLGGLISGTKYRGEFEQRMKKLTDEIKAESRVIILFIDEIHMIEQAKGAEGAMNVSDIIKPALSRGQLQAIGATTWKEYQEHIKPDDALNRRFQPVIIGEPSKKASLEIIQGIKNLYEDYHHVRYEEDALKAAVDLSVTNIHDRFLPDKAIDLLDEAGAKVSIDAGENARHMMGLLHAAGKTVSKRRAGLVTKEKQLKTELTHLKNLEKNVTTVSILTSVREQMERLIDEVHAMQSAKGSGKEKIPVVTVEDIQSIVKEWSGHQRKSK